MQVVSDFYVIKKIKYVHISNIKVTG